MNTIRRSSIRISAFAAGAALLLGLFGCDNWNASDKPESSAQAGPIEESSVLAPLHEVDIESEASEAASSSSDQQPGEKDLALSAMISDESLSFLTDGDASEVIVLATEEVVFSLEWEKPVDVDRIVTYANDGAGYSMAFTAFGADGAVLAEYSKGSCTGKRISALACREVSRLVLSYAPHDAALELSEVEIYGEKPGGTAVPVTSAYLPVNSAFDAELFEGQLGALDDIILISGSYWGADGSITVSDGFAGHCSSIEETLQNEANAPRIWATIYPAYKMTSDGSAGSTIDTREKREKLIDNILAFAEEYGLDGIDFDWEFPREAADWEHFGELIAELKGRGGALMISAALYPDRTMMTDDGFAALDRVNLMTYDCFDDLGRHSTYELAENSVNCIGYFAERPGERHKLFIGIPAYGRPLDGSRVWDLYRDIPVMNRNLDFYGNSFYNGCALAADKTALAFELGAGGVFLYHLKCDKPFEDDFSLLRSISDYLAFGQDNVK